MTVQFNQIPENIRVPFMYFEINPGQAPYVSNARVLLMGQKLASGTATADEPIMVTGGEDGLFGVNSQLAAMYKAARKVGPFQEIWAVPLADAGGAAKATGTINVNSAAPHNGTLVYYIGDNRIQVPVNTLMTVAEIVASLVQAVNTCTAIQVKATAGSAGADSTGTITITGTATGAGVLGATIDGTTVSASIASGDTPTVAAGKLVTAINANPILSNLLVASNALGVITLTSISTGTLLNGAALSGTSTAASMTVATSSTMSGGTATVVTLTANNAGTLGNTIGINYSWSSLDPNTAQAITTITPMANGASDPTITNALSNLGDQEFDWIAMPYVEYITQLEQFLEQRWMYSSQLYGFGITVYEATAGALTSLGAQLNGPYTAIVGVYNIPAPVYLWCAQITTLAGVHLQSPPELSRPLQTLELPGLDPAPNVSDRWTALERQMFYFSGISACTERRDGTVVIDRLISTYQTNAWGSQDSTWLDVNTLAQVMYGVRYLKQLLTSTYPRSALANQNPNNLQGVVTVNDIRNTLVHGYKQLCDLGVFDDADIFDQLLIVERNSQDPDRVDCYLPVETVGQLRILAANASVYLKYPTN